MQIQIFASDLFDYYMKVQSLSLKDEGAEIRRKKTPDFETIHVPSAGQTSRLNTNIIKWKLFHAVEL